MALITESRLVRIEREVDLFVARESARMMASRAGFDEFESANVETAVSEMCSNVLRHGVEGWAMLRNLPHGLEVEVVDRGPGFGNAPVRSDGLGIGLAGAERLMDQLLVENLDVGARVVARKLSPREVDGDDMWWTAVCASVAFGGEISSGDAYFVEQRSGVLLVGIVDGLGHGDGAAAAADAAISGLRGHPGVDPVTLLRHGDETARAGRGAVALVASVDPRTSLVTYAGVGDISGRVLPGDERLLSQSGCLGVRLPRVTQGQVPWGRGSSLALWTDGVELGDEALSDPIADPADWVESRLRRHSNGRDDGLLLLLTSR